MSNILVDAVNYNRKELGLEPITICQFCGDGFIGDGSVPFCTPLCKDEQDKYDEERGKAFLIFKQQEAQLMDAIRKGVNELIESALERYYNSKSKV